MFACGHSYHLPCLSSAGCATVSALGDEKWHCYRCVASKSDSAAEQARGGRPVATATALPPLPAVDETALDRMTNQRLVQARAYMAGFKTGIPPLNLVDLINSESFKEENDFLGERVAIFDRPDFKLRYWTNEDGEG